jgi:regulator of sigma E protease
MLFTVLAFLVALGILIIFHELGHYWVARWCGVKILRFSLGFGRVLLKRVDRHGTEWVLSALPLGGYVKMLDEEQQPVIHTATPVRQNPQSFQAQPVGKRIAIVAAGPLFNLILAVVFYASINLVGTQEPAAILSKPPAASAAAMAGLQGGDRITAVNQQTVMSWPQVRWALLQLAADGGQVEIAFERGGSPLTRVLEVPAAADPAAEDPMRRLGLAVGGSTPQIRSVVESSVAQAAGLSVNDLIVSIGGERQPDVAQVIRIIQSHANQPLALEVQREGQIRQITLTPAAVTLENGKSVGRAGFQLVGNLPMVDVSYGLLDSVWLGVTKTYDTAWFSLKMMGKMLIGEVSIKNISGPVTIADYAGQTARIGWAAYISFLALVSVSLGVLNLLPIPMLDGGHLLYYLVEIIRGSPPSARSVDWGQRAGMAVLAGLMVIALFNDLVRVFN